VGRKLIIGVIGFGLGRTARDSSAVAGRFSHGITVFTAIEMGTRDKPDGGDLIRATVGQPAPREFNLWSAKTVDKPKLCAGAWESEIDFRNLSKPCI
jgi:hypothetical protein